MFFLETIKILDIKKCIVYLKSIAEANIFENVLKTINLYYNLKLAVYNINYNTSKTLRNTNLTKFRNNNTKISIMLNVHILDEGIDIPECDSVYLTHPNNNPINIIQRISRANRIYKDKNIAKILIWSKDETKLNDVIKRIETYIPVKFNNINNKFINNKHQNNIIETKHNLLLKTSNLNAEFIETYNVFKKQCENNKFGISIENVMKYLNIKDRIKLEERLRMRYKLNEDYQIIRLQKKLTKGIKDVHYMISLESFHKIVMKSTTKKGLEFRDNFIKLGNPIL